jgi:hypothetical protein
MFGLWRQRGGAEPRTWRRKATWANIGTSKELESTKFRKDTAEIDPSEIPAKPEAYTCYPRVVPITSLLRKQAKPLRG